MQTRFPSPGRWRLLAPALLGLALIGTAHADARGNVALVETTPAAAMPARADAAPAARTAPREIGIGTATEALWALQRASRGTHPRPIDGDQASRSYQRYLKSFETEIPAQYNTGLDLQK
ncbi:DUF3613 domain-containing protein [Comamonas endophytica]|uniref:DUF3613 domain-containing protein n=1 Tax=Comamonas endophytica TaxID=2949090 RepID=A0ABY6GA65_9BURK|nr:MULTISPECIES: DUF3613 domain-containing protein [unclassified Acidovorax]MCD2512155.1 DUF3613 domain-containing protein [Acidovorax sp. D4N7]UYG51928.1 DUF3613 domain-containing protein [Acidovorax sp. 5MLIR]